MEGINNLLMSDKGVKFYDITFKCAISRDVSVILLFYFSLRK